MKQLITKNFLLIVLILATAFAFAMKATIFQKQPGAKPKPADTLSASFAHYWFSGQTELNSYRLQQAYDGVLNSGEAMLVFETENFRTDTQVKSKSPDKSTPVLTANLSKKFVTGIADYSLLTSVFTPVNNPAFPNTLKVSTSVQNWGGHSYLQLNYANTGYQVSGKSYVENDANGEYILAKDILEDELWNRIRLNPDKLPSGETQLIPGTMTAQLRHKHLEPLRANVTLADYKGVLYPGKFLKSYTIQYPTDNRTLVIIFESQFPHKIAGWEETYNTKNNLLTSRAVLQKTIQTNHLNHNSPTDSTFRKALRLNL